MQIIKDHPHGVTASSLKEQLGEERYKAFTAWMVGQTGVLAKNGEIVYFTWDIERWLEGRPVID